MHWSIFARPEILAPFFFLVGLQLRAELTHIGQIALPSFAALGGMALPALIFIVREPHHRGAWPIVAPTDLALVMASIIILGRRISPALRTFLLALAVADDLFSLLVMAAKYATAIRLSNLIATMGAVALGALLPSFSWEIPLTFVVNYFLLPIYIVASFAPLFSAPHSVWSSHLAISIAAARFIGKPIGIFCFMLIASRAPRIFGKRSISLREALAGGALAGMGLAVSLVITSFTFASAEPASQAKAGLVLAVPLSFLMAVLFSKRAAH